MQIKDSTEDKDKLYLYFITFYYSHTTNSFIDDLGCKRFDFGSTIIFREVGNLGPVPFGHIHSYTDIYLKK